MSVRQELGLIGFVELTEVLAKKIIDKIAVLISSENTNIQELSTRLLGFILSSSQLDSTKTTFVSINALALYLKKEVVHNQNLSIKKLEELIEEAIRE